MAGNPSLDLFSFEEEYDGDDFNPLVEQEFKLDETNYLGICGSRDATSLRISIGHDNTHIVFFIPRDQLEGIYNLIGKHLGK